MHKNVTPLSYSQTIPASKKKIIFHENGPWCQKGWGQLLYCHLLPYPGPHLGSQVAFGCLISFALCN